MAEAQSPKTKEKVFLKFGIWNLELIFSPSLSSLSSLLEKFEFYLVWIWNLFEIWNLKFEILAFSPTAEKARIGSLPYSSNVIFPDTLIKIVEGGQSGGYRL